MVGRKLSTLPTPLNTSSMMSDCSTSFTCAAASPDATTSVSAVIPPSSSSDSHAPTTLNVSQNTSAMMATNAGMAVKGPVSSLSMRVLRACSRLSVGFTTVCSHTRPMKLNRMSAMAAARSRPRSASIWQMMCSSASFSFWSRSSRSSTSWSPSASLLAANRGGMPARSAWSSMSAMMLCRQRWTAPSCSSGAQKSWRTGGSWNRATCRAWSTSSAVPSFLDAEMGMTGMPSSFSISFTWMVPPLPSTSSIMLRASTMGMPSSMSCIVRYRLRSTFVASTMLTMPRGRSSSRKRRVTTSSLEYGDME